VLAALIWTLPPAFSQTSAAGQSAPGVPSDDRISALLASLRQVRAPSSVSISPDGKTLAWPVNGAHGSEVHLTDLSSSTGSSAQDRLLAPDTVGASAAPGACGGSHPNWSPDGMQLAFLSGCSQEDGSWKKDTQENVFVWSVAGNAVRQVSHLHGAVSNLAWSPDNKSIAFLYVEGATRRAGALDAMKPWSGVYGEDGVEVQRVYAVNVDDGDGYWLTRENLHAYEFSWAPNSNEIVFVAADPPGENNWWIAKLYTSLVPHRQLPVGIMCVTADKNQPNCPSGDEKVVLDPAKSSGSLHGLQIAVPRFSPDGKQIAFIGGLMSDQGSTGGDIYLVASAGGEPKDITPGRAASPAYIGWLAGSVLGVSEHVGGDSHITAIDVDSGRDVRQVNLTLPDTIIAGPDVMSIAVARSSRIVAMIRQSFEHPPEVWAGPLNNLKQITHLNDALRPAWGRAESIEYENDGFHLQGWLIYPASYDPAKRYPLIVSVHGGPSSAVTPRWPTAAYGAIPFSALGYFVFLPNPRGSFGQGEKFTQANVKDFGYGDLHDVLAGMDVLEKRFPIDKEREGLTGWSYGGFMTMFGVTQTTRFKAAVAGAGISDWQSYYGENSIDQWMVPFFGKTVYDDPAVYARSSAIDFIKNVKTPTLVVVGDRDGECPAPQSFEFWHALRAEGVKTQLVIYPNEGHRFVDPAHQSNVLERALGWFEGEMLAKQPPAAAASRKP
jgi:dipeptidyl aminopeptidase/acylaminoacyl peptidase